MKDYKGEVWYVRKAQNLFGPKKKACHKGEFNVTKDEDGEIYLNIYYRNKLILKMRHYGHPFHVASAILGVSNTEEIVKQIEFLHSLGYIAGVDFGVTMKGVYLKNTYGY